MNPLPYPGDFVISSIVEDWMNIPGYLETEVFIQEIDTSSNSRITKNSIFWIHHFN